MLITSLESLRMAQVLDLDEHEDGSATITFDFTPEEMKSLLNFAVTEALMNGLNQNKRTVVTEDFYDLGGTD
jgi:hypothetical protein